MVIKSHASELGGYEESRIAVLTLIHTHTAEERDRTQPQVPSLILQ